MVGVGLSLLVIAVGAVLSFAVDYELVGIDLNTVGWILIIVGVAGLIIALAYAAGLFGGKRQTATGPDEYRPSGPQGL